MKIPLYLKCKNEKCNTEEYVWIDLHLGDFEHHCISCGHSESYFFDLGVTVGYNSSSANFMVLA